MNLHRLAAASIGQAMQRLVLWWLVLTVATAVTLTGLGFLVFAAYLELASRMAPPAAAAATGGLLLAGALALTGGTALVTRRRPPANPPRPGTERVDNLLAVIDGLRHRFESELKSSAGTLTIASLVAGCAIGYSPRLRRVLKDLLR